MKYKVLFVNFSVIILSLFVDSLINGYIFVMHTNIGNNQNNTQLK
jgi:hypothetical protein